GLLGSSLRSWLRQPHQAGSHWVAALPRPPSIGGHAGRRRSADAYRARATTSAGEAWKRPPAGWIANSPPAAGGGVERKRENPLASMNLVDDPSEGSCPSPPARERPRRTVLASSAASTRGKQTKCSSLETIAGFRVPCQAQLRAVTDDPLSSGASRMR